MDKLQQDMDEARSYALKCREDVNKLAKKRDVVLDNNKKKKAGGSAKTLALAEKALQAGIDTQKNADTALLAAEKAYQSKVEHQQRIAQEDLAKMSTHDKQQSAGYEKGTGSQTHRKSANQARVNELANILEKKKATAQRDQLIRDAQKHADNVLEEAARRLDNEAEAKKLADKAKLVEKKRLDDEAKAKRLADEAKLMEKKRLDDEAKLAEAKKLADEAKLVEKKRLDDEAKAKRLANEAKLVEKKRLDDEAKLAEAKKLANEAKLVEKKRIDDEAKLVGKKQLDNEAKKQLDVKNRNTVDLVEKKRHDDEARKQADKKNQNEAGLVEKRTLDDEDDEYEAVETDDDDSDSGAKRKGAKVAKVLGHWQRWLEMSTKEQRNKTRSGELAIEVFLLKLKQGKKNVKLPSTVRTMIRNVQPFLPMAATTNRQLALACLASSPGNHMCRYHQMKSKRQGIIDGEHTGKNPGEYQVMGVPHSRVIASKNGAQSSVKGFLNCGCSEEEVLFEFFFWKTWKITSPTTGVTEGWLDQTLDPRSRVFIVSAFKEATKLTLEDLYSNDLTRDYDSHRKILLALQIKRLTEELDRLENDGVAK